MQKQQDQTAAAAALPNPDVITRADPEDAVELEKKDQAPNPNAQIGVQKIEAVTLSWTKAGVAALLFKYVSSRHNHYRQD